MCEHGDGILVNVKIAADLSASGQAKWKDARIDRCIAGLVKALQQGGIHMRGSCCGHGKTVGDIHLQDGRILLILSVEASERYMAADADDRPRLVAAEFAEAR